MKKIIFIAICLLIGLFSQNHIVAIQTPAAKGESNLQSSSPTNLIHSNRMIPLEGDRIIDPSLENSLPIKTSKNWFARLSNWFNSTYHKMHGKWDQWFFLEAHEAFYGLG